MKTVARMAKEEIEKVMKAGQEKDRSYFGTKDFKAHVSPGTDLVKLAGYLRDSLKDDVGEERGEGWKDHGLVLKCGKGYGKKVRVTILIEEV